MKASPETSEIAPKTTEKYEAGPWWSLYDAMAAKAPKINPIGVTIPCIGLESSGNTPTPMVAKPVIRNRMKKRRDWLKLRISMDETNTLTPRMIVDVL